MEFEIRGEELNGRAQSTEKVCLDAEFGEGGMLKSF
jgi:hypothetical protein